MANIDDDARHNIDQFLASKAETEFGDVHGTRPGKGPVVPGETLTSEGEVRQVQLSVSVKVFTPGYVQKLLVRVVNF